MIQQSNGNGIMLNTGDSGPMMQGTWWNPNTGHKFTVKDCYFEDGDFTVITTDGQRLNYNTIQNYIQCTNGKGEEVTPPSTPTKESTHPIPKQVLDELDTDDQNNDIILPEDMELGNLYKPQPQDTAPKNEPATEQPAPQENPVDNVDLTMIKRVLDRFPVPTINAQLGWPDAPNRQIDTLVNLLGIAPEDIATYYAVHLDTRQIFELTRNAIKEYICRIADQQVTPKETPKETPNVVDQAKPISKRGSRGSKAVKK